MDDLEFEKKYWGSCVNTFDEDQKHYMYAMGMGLIREHYSFNVFGKRIADIGGGPSSMLLKTINLAEGLVIDPIDYPQWTKDRYKCHNIKVAVRGGEVPLTENWDEVWIYNCLQHTEDPRVIISNALECSSFVRIFEWIDIPPHEGHPHELTEKFFKECFADTIALGAGVNNFAEQGCYGKAFYGYFGKIL
jgi:hypothetical protein